jgi:hypothetical protein
VSTATVTFEKLFEGCSGCNEAARISYAQSVLTAYGSTPTPLQKDGGRAADGDAGWAPHDAGTVVTGGPLDGGLLGTAPARAGVAQGCGINPGGEDGAAEVGCALLLFAALIRKRSRSTNGGPT